MKCKKCGIENDASAKFCRACGILLESKPIENIMDKYPKYEFVPTNLIEWKKPKLSRFFFLMFLLVFFMSSSTSAYYLYSYNHYNVDISEEAQTVAVEATDEKKKEPVETTDECYEGEIEYEDYIEEAVPEYDEPQYIEVEKNFYSASCEDLFCTINGYVGPYYEDKDEAEKYAVEEYERKCIPFIAGFGVLSIIACIICCIVFRSYPSSSTKSIRIYADYIQKYTYTGVFSSRSKPMFRFYVKDNKFGLMDVSHYKVHLNAEYDFLSWREKGKFLTAHQGNRVFIIDINGKELK